MSKTTWRPFIPPPWPKRQTRAICRRRAHSRLSQHRAGQPRGVSAFPGPGIIQRYGFHRGPLPICTATRWVNCQCGATVRIYLVREDKHRTANSGSYSFLPSTSGKNPNWDPKHRLNSHESISWYGQLAYMRPWRQMYMRCKPLPGDLVISVQ